jgi:hypothetical protein
MHYSLNTLNKLRVLRKQMRLSGNKYRCKVSTPPEGLEVILVGTHCPHSLITKLTNPVKTDLTIISIDRKLFLSI